MLKKRLASTSPSREDFEAAVKSWRHSVKRAALLHPAAPADLLVKAYWGGFRARLILAKRKSYPWELAQAVFEGVTEGEWQSGVVLTEGRADDPLLQAAGAEVRERILRSGTRGQNLNFNKFILTTDLLFTELGEREIRTMTSPDFIDLEQVRHLSAHSLVHFYRNHGRFGEGSEGALGRPFNWEDFSSLSMDLGSIFLLEPEHEKQVYQGILKAREEAEAKRSCGGAASRRGGLFGRKEAEVAEVKKSVAAQFEEAVRASKALISTLGEAATPGSLGAIREQEAGFKKLLALSEVLASSPDTPSRKRSAASLERSMRKALGEIRELLDSLTQLSVARTRSSENPLSRVTLITRAQTGLLRSDPERVELEGLQLRAGS